MIFQSVSDNIVFSPIFFEVLMYLISFFIVYIIMKNIGYKSLDGILAIHISFLFMFIVLNVIDPFFIVVLIIELLVVLRVNSRGDEENGNRD